MSAVDLCNVETILVSGGVPANSQLRATFEGRARERGVRVYFPDRELSTDNAAMIAAAAFAGFKQGKFADVSLNAKASMPLG